MLLLLLLLLPTPSYEIGIKMGLIDLPVELMEFIVDYTIPRNWKYYSDRQWVLNLRLLCSKPFILSFHFVVSQLSSSVSFIIV